MRCFTVSAGARLFAWCSALLLHQIPLSLFLLHPVKSSKWKRLGRGAVLANAPQLLQEASCFHLAKCLGASYHCWKNSLFLFMCIGKLMASVWGMFPWRCFSFPFLIQRKLGSVETYRAVETQRWSDCRISHSGVCCFSVLQQSLSMNDTSSEFRKMPFYAKRINALSASFLCIHVCMAGGIMRTC